MTAQVLISTTLGMRQHTGVTAVSGNADGSLTIDSGDYRTTYAAGVWRSYEETETA